MYSKTPKIEKNADGKPGITRPKGDEADKAGTEGAGSTLENAGEGIPVDIHEKERSSMHKRHEEEQKAMHSRHDKDLKDMHSRHESVPLPAAGENIEGTK